MNKIPLLMVPGTLNNARVWQGQADALASAAEIHVADVSTQESTAAMADDALRAVPGRFALAGFSLGGYVALEIMRRAPERVAGLCLLSTSARAETEEAKPGRRKSIELAQRDFARLIANMRPFMLSPANLADGALNAALDRMMNEVGAEAFARQSRAVIGRAESRNLLASIRCPTVVACGRDDQVTPLRLSEEMAAAIPGARLEVLDHAGHMATFEAPDRVTRLMAQWLDSIEGWGARA